MNILDYQAMIWGYESEQRQEKLVNDVSITKKQAQEFLQMASKVLNLVGLGRLASQKQGE